MSVQNLMTPGDFIIRKNKKRESTTPLLTPAYYYVKPTHIRVSKQGKKEVYIPRIARTCQKCENVRRIKENTVVQTGCFCSEIIPPTYLTTVPSADDIYTEMTPENDLPW